MPTSTIDQHAINRSKLVERMAGFCAKAAYTAEDIVGNEWVRGQVVADAEAASYPSPTTWALLVIRLGGDL
jgi:hypothetical protein